jgi:citrate synthase
VRRERERVFSSSSPSSFSFLFRSFRVFLFHAASFFSPGFFSLSRPLFISLHLHSYVAHWREQLSDPDLKIVRPQEVYEGEWLRDVEPVSARRGPDPSLKGIDEFGKLPASNAYRRRVAGENWQ